MATFRTIVFSISMAGLFLSAPPVYAQDIGASAVPPAVIEEWASAQAETARQLEVPRPTQILFGDTHVHTTYSVDAYFWGLPLMQGQGEGAYPPFDACDYARYCSALDFYVLTDHAEAFTAQHWKTAKESIRQCNAVAGDPASPDLAAFIGFEWTQVGQTPETHYGHKNVLFLDTADEKVPARPIGAKGLASDTLRGSAAQRIAMLAAVDRKHPKPYLDFGVFSRSMQATPDCAEGVNTRDLPEDCFESTTTPAELYEKLDQWGFDTIVIPHGSTWGFYTPPGTTFDKHLKPDGYDPDKQILIEIYSGHGNSEQYKEWRAIRYDDDGNSYCPEPTKDYLPSCWRAGEIIRERCLASGLDERECEARAVQARKHFVEVPTIASHRTIPGQDVEDWLDSGQARGMFQPSFNYRPAESVQYTMTIANFDDPENPLRHRWGFIASSDNHRARPGTGYKEIDRHRTTEGSGPRSYRFQKFLNGGTTYPAPRSIPIQEGIVGVQGFQLTEMERQASFFMTGGLAAVHTEGRSREAIWAAMKRKETYGTSGDRILLWFDLVNGPEGRVPMGGEARMSEAPRFEVRAAGAFKQLPGCPEHSKGALSQERLLDLCKGECYNPSDERKMITRIEVVRIRPQTSPNEDVGGLIEDPWRVFNCESSTEGCSVQFTDETYPDSDRDFIYYVRAIQEPSPAINGQNLRPRYDTRGNVVSVEPCYGDYRSPADDDCLSDVEERAWSSPIFIDREKG